MNEEKIAEIGNRNMLRIHSCEGPHGLTPCKWEQEKPTHFRCRLCGGEFTAEQAYFYNMGLIDGVNNPEYLDL